MYTIRSLSKEMKVPYTTLRGYIMDLKKLGLIKAPDGPNGLIINDAEKNLIESVVKLIRERGYSFRAAVEVLTSDENKSDLSVKMEKILLRLDELERKLEKLEEACTNKRKRKWLWFWK